MDITTEALVITEDDIAQWIGNDVIHVETTEDTNETPTKETKLKHEGDTINEAVKMTHQSSEVSKKQPTRKQIEREAALARRAKLLLHTEEAKAEVERLLDNKNVQ